MNSFILFISRKVRKETKIVKNIFDHDKSPLVTATLFKIHFIPAPPVKTNDKFIVFFFFFFISRKVIK